MPDWEAQQAQGIAGNIEHSLATLIKESGIGGGGLALVKLLFKKFGPLAAYYGGALATVALQLSALDLMFQKEHDHSLDWFKDTNNL
ncbi:MAG TPA: hypothetical protein VJN88_03875, partial [Ktedonobacterales bacterium]|nr:hypothetical protein [Ktedonobacterales bacterium]